MIFYHTKFRELCKLKRWGPTSIARACGVTRQSVYLWTSGDIVPSEKNIRKLALVIDVPLSEISIYQDEMPLSNLEIPAIIQSFISSANSTKEVRKTGSENIISLVIQQYRKEKQLSITTKAILNSIHSILYIKDINSKFIIVNQEFIKKLNLPSKHIILGKSDSDLFPKDEAEENYREDLDIIRTGNPVTNRENYIIGSRKKKWGLISKTPIFENNKIAGVIGSITDITEKKKHETALLFLTKSISKLQNKNMSYGIFDKNNSLIYADRSAYEEMFGIPQTVPAMECTAYWLNEIVHKNDTTEQATYVSSGYVDVPPVRKYRIIHPKKGLRWIRETTSWYLDSIMSFSEDITKQK